MFPKDIIFGQEVRKFDSDGYRITHNDKPLNPLKLPTKIGHRLEREENHKYWRLNKISQIGNEAIFRVKLYNEIRRYIANLDLPLNKDHVFHLALNFYKKLLPRTKFRSIRLIAPITIYVSCLENTIFLNRKAISEHFDCDPNDFNRGLREFYAKYQKLYKKHLSDWFRKEIIYNALIGLKNSFDLPEDFLNLAGNFLFKTFEVAKNRTNTAIALFVFTLVKRFYNGQMRKTPISRIANFLGVEQSVINNNTLLLKQMKRRL